MVPALKSKSNCTLCISIFRSVSTRLHPLFLKSMEIHLQKHPLFVGIYGPCLQPKNSFSMQMRTSVRSAFRLDCRGRVQNSFFAPWFFPKQHIRLSEQDSNTRHYDRIFPVYRFHGFLSLHETPKQNVLWFDRNVTWGKYQHVKTSLVFLSEIGSKNEKQRD